MTLPVSGIKPYKCSLCPKAFIQQCKLNDHLRRHRGERRFRCVMCDKMYAASHDLRSHLRSEHDRAGGLMVTCGVDRVGFLKLNAIPTSTGSAEVRVNRFFFV